MPVECIVCTGVWVVLCCGQAGHGHVDSGASWEEIWCRPRPTTACALLGTTWYELQSGLLMISSYAGLESTWERLNCEPRPATTSAKLGTA